MAGRGTGVTCSTVVAALPVAGLGRGASGRDRRVLGVRRGRVGRLPRLVTVAGRCCGAARSRAAGPSTRGGGTGAGCLRGDDDAGAPSLVRTMEMTAAPLRLRTGDCGPHARPPRGGRTSRRPRSYRLVRRQSSVVIVVLTQRDCRLIGWCLAHTPYSPRAGQVLRGTASGGCPVESLLPRRSPAHVRGSDRKIGHPSSVSHSAVLSASSSPTW